jgi:hypothetical protein
MRCDRAGAIGWCAFCWRQAQGSVHRHVSCADAGLSLANYDDNQHIDNENPWLGNLWNGIATLASIMTAK